MAMATGEHGRGAAHRLRSRPKRVAAEPIERAHDAEVDLGCLPRLLGYNLRRAHQSSWRHYVATIGENKIRPGLFSLLVLARSNPGICQIELGRHLGVDKASMVALLDRLETVGLIERRRSTRDRRRQGIFITAGGLNELETLLVDVRVLEKQMANRYSKAELEQFISLLQRMYD